MKSCDNNLAVYEVPHHKRFVKLLRTVEPKSADRRSIVRKEQIILSNLVRVEGLEPPRLAAPEPKSGASTNFATPAF